MAAEGGRERPGANGRDAPDRIDEDSIDDSMTEDRIDEDRIDEDRIDELEELHEPASEQLAGRVQRAVDRVETAAHIGDFSGGVLKRVLFEMVSLLIGLFTVKDQPRDEGSD